MRAPVLFIVFRRLDVTKQSFEQIRQSKPPRLYIACDGPRNDNERAEVIAIRGYVLSHIDWSCQVHTLFSDTNLGVGVAPFKAITWFFEHEQEGIILEDDCLPSSDFFEFCDEMLVKYRNNNDVSMVQGFNPFPVFDIRSSYFFSRYNLCWGWASWRDRWEGYDFFISSWKTPGISMLYRISQGHLMVRLYWLFIFNSIIRNPSLGWDAQLTLLFFERNQHAIVPARNLILNTGFESEYATSTKYLAPEHIRLLTLQLMEKPLRHPHGVEVSLDYEKLVERKHFDINPITILKLALKDFMESHRIFSVLLPSARRLSHMFHRLSLKVRKKE